MTVWLYCICRNEERMMPYFLRHYSTWVDKLIFYDGRSTDGTRSLIQSCPKAELRDWPGEDGLVDDQFRDFANEQWKESKGKADWVLWVDADELLYHPSMLELLDRYLKEGVEVPHVAGFAMVWSRFPTSSGQIYDEIKTGFRSPEWDKPEIFRPCLNMAWNVGRHSLNLDIIGRNPVSSREREIKLLHYRYFGLDYIRERGEKNVSRQPQRCKLLNYGDNNFPGATKAYSVNWFKDVLKQQFPEVI